MSSEPTPQQQLQATQFALDLMQNLFHNGSNLVFSPFSLVSALAMLLPGTDGNSRSQLVKALFDVKYEGGQAEADDFLEQFATANRANLEKNAATLKVANHLYSHKSFPLNTEYVSTLTSQLRAIGKQLDFVAEKAVALKTINSDVSKATQGLIPELLNDISPATILILVNAIYFKGLWAKPFEKDLTIEGGEFTTSTGEMIKAPLMSKRRKFPFYADQKTQMKAVQLDYQKDGNIAMVLLLPGEGVSMGAFLQNELTAGKLHTILESFTSYSQVNLTLPRFKLTATHQLVKPLNQLGLSDLFDSSKANFRRISSHPGPLVVSEVIQKAVIEVNEEGTEAAAATAITMKLGCCAMPSPPEEYFNANRPFVFALVTLDSPKQVLFLGVVENPNN